MAKAIIDLSNLPDITNDKFIPLYEDKNRYLVLVGGGGSGKSVFAAQKKIYRTLTEPGHRILVVRKVAKTLRESVFALLRGTVSEWGMSDLFQVNKSDIYMKCKINGNEILFAGLDDVEKLKSIYNVTSIWIEEASELEPEDYRQLDIRLRGHTAWYKQIIFSFNPIYKGHWLELEFLDELWRPTKPNTTAHHSTYKDNRFLDKEQIAVLESFRDKDPYYYSVYCLGEWGVLGKTIFDAQKVTERIAFLRNKKPLKEGFFVYEYENEKIKDDTIKWIDEPGGYIRIYEDVKWGHPYVIGGDTAGEGSDWFTGQVINNATGVQAATLRHQFDEDLYAKQMYCLGKYYNKAMLSIETNFSTYPVKELQRLGYSRQYVREVEDTYTKKTRETFGFKTTKITRPAAIAGLVELVREHIDLFNDIQTLEEMLTFVRNEHGKAEAQEGKTDDLILGLAIGHFTKWQQSSKIKVPKEEKTVIQRDKEKLAKARAGAGVRTRRRVV